MRRGLLLLLLLAGAASAWLLRPPPTVDAVRPVVREVREVVVATGRLEAGRSAALSFEERGVVSQVSVARGDRVRAGQVLATLDPAPARQALREAEARARTSRAERDRVLRGPAAEDVERARAQLVAAEAGRLQLQAARQRLADLLVGRPEAVRGAEAALSQARAALRAAGEALHVQEQALRAATAAREQAEADFRRAEALYTAGAVAAADVERARSALDRARAEEDAARARVRGEEARVGAAEQQVRAALEQLHLARRPASPAQVEAARAEVRALEARVEAEVRAARAALVALLRAPRPEDARVADARYREALEAVRAARERLARTALRAPYDAVVVDVHRAEGSVVQPGEAVLTLADLRSLEVVVDLDEENLARIRVGQPAALIAPGTPRAPVAARLVSVDPQVDPQRGTVRARLRLLRLPNPVRVGMTLDVNLEVAVWPSALAVPLEAVVGAAVRPSVFVVRGGRVEARPVRVLGRSDRWVALEGLSPEALVVVDPTRVRPGQRVRVRVVRPQE